MKRVLFIGFCILMSMGLYAQTTSGEINGTVTDNTNVALPGVTVTIASPSLQGTRTTVTNANGFFRLPLLPIGVYQATFSIPGFATFTKKNIGVKVGERTRVDASLQPANLEESIVVTAEAPLIDTSTTDSSVEMDTQMLAAIPTLTRSVEDMAKFVPGVAGVRMDAVNGGENGLPNIRGSGQEANAYMVDGLSSRGSMNFDNAVAQNFDSIESLQIVTDPYSPEYGKTMGGAINVVTKSGGNELHGEAGALYRNDALMSRQQSVQNPNAWTGFDNNQQWYNLGGPIIKDKLWFFVSYNYNKRTLNYDAPDPKIIEAENLVNYDGTPVTNDYTVYTYGDGSNYATNDSLFAKLTYNINENMSLGFSALDASVETEQTAGMVDLLRNTSTDQSRYRLNFNWIIGDLGVLELKWGQQESDFISRPINGTDIASRYITTIAWGYANRSRWDEQAEKRTDWAAKFTGYLDTETLGSHEFSIGIEYEEFQTQWLLGHTGGAEQVMVDSEFPWMESAEFNMKYETNESGQIILGPDGNPIITPRYLYQYNHQWNDNQVKNQGIFLQDRITYGNWTFMLGLRADKNKVYPVRGEEAIWTWDFTDYLVPRISVIYDLFGDQNHIFKFAYGEFKDATTTRVAEFFAPEGGNTYVRYGWIGPEGPTEAELHDPANWEYRSDQTPHMEFDPDLEPNSQKRWMAEYNWRINPQHAMTVRYTRAWASDLLEDIAYIGEDGWDYWALANLDIKRRDYESIDVEFNGRFGNWLDYMFTYSWQDARGTNPGNFENETLNNPGGSGQYIGVFGDHVLWDGVTRTGYWAPWMSSYGDYIDYTDWIVGETAGLGGSQYGDEGWYGRLSDVPMHSINFVGNFHLPKDFNITAALQWNSGFYWTKKGFQGLYGSYFTFLEGRGSRRTSSLLWVDVTVTKDFKLFDDHFFQLRLDVFNLFNTQHPISYVEEDTIDFGKPFARQAPRSIQVGVLYRF